MIYAILLLGLGLALIVAEVLFPSLGVLGALATISIVAGAYVAFRADQSTGMTYLAVTSILVPIFIISGFRLLPRSPLARQLMARGFTFEDGRATDRRDENLSGAEGIVEAQLRPAGVARIEGRRVDVVSRGGSIEKGTRVRVVELKGNRVVVAPCSDFADADHSDREPSDSDPV